MSAPLLSPRGDSVPTPRAFALPSTIKSTALDEYDINWRITAPAVFIRELCLLRKKFLLKEFLEVRNERGELLIKPVNWSWNMTISSDLIYADEATMLEMLLNAKVLVVTANILQLAASLGTNTFGIVVNFLPDPATIADCLPTVRGYLRGRQREDLLALLESKLQPV